MPQWIANAYYWLLWYCGFRDTDNDLSTPDDREKITFMLRRAKERIGLFWWILSIGLFWVLQWQIIAYARYWVIPIYLFQVWLFIHILYPAKFVPHKGT